MVGGAFLASMLIAPDKPNAQKLSSYECGEEVSGSSWVPFNSRFYVIALIFLLFDVEMVFIFPWATVFAQQQLIDADSRWGWLTLIEMFIFLLILILGLIYVWRKGDLNWIKSEPVKPVTTVKIPFSLYEKINQITYTVKPFITAPPPVEANLPVGKPAEALPPPVRKPMFKPAFKKPQNES